MFMRLEPKISSVSSVATTFWCRKILQNLILCLRFAPEKTRIRPSRMLRSARSPDGLLSTPPERFTSAVDKTRLFTRFVHENNFVLFLNGPSRPLFCLFSSFSHYNFNDTNWKKHRWCVWDSNPLLQYGRHRQYHRAMAAAPVVMISYVLKPIKFRVSAILRS